MKKLKKKMMTKTDQENLSKSIFPNYTKTALETTSNILNLLFSIIFEKYKKTNLINSSLIHQKKKRIILILDEIEGRDAEDIIKSIEKENRENFYFYRCSYKSKNKKNNYNFGIWHNILSIKKEEVEEKIDYKIGTSEENQLNPISLYEKFKKFLLNPEQLIENNFPNLEKNPNYITTENWPNKKKEIIAIDCEMVETTKGIELARISLVNENYKVLYDHLVMPENSIINYYTKINGLTPDLFEKNDVKSMKEVREDLKKFIGRDSILVGHSLENDLRSIGLLHGNVVDTSVIFPKRDGFKYSLKTLAFNYLKIKIQEGAHDSREDARFSLAVAKIGIEILPYFKKNNNNSDPYFFFRNYVKKNKVAIFDFENNIRSYLKYGIFQESINESSQVIDKINEYLKKWEEFKEYLILTRFNMNSFGNLEKKKDKLKQFIKKIHAEKPDHLLLVCTVGHYNKVINNNYGYDFMMVSKNN